METKRKYERAAPAGDPLPTVVAPERALRVVTRPERNPGTALDLDLVRALRVNRSARGAQSPAPAHRRDWRVGGGRSAGDRRGDHSGPRPRRRLASAL